MKQALKGLLSLSLLLSAASMFADSCSPCSPSSCDTRNSCSPCGTTSSNFNCCDFSDCCEDQGRCCEDDVYYGKTHFSLRPQGMNAARTLLGNANRTHVFGREEFYGVASIAIQYQQTFDHDNNCKRSLGTWFAPTCSNSITFGPDQNAATEALNPAVLAPTTLTASVLAPVNVALSTCPPGVNLTASIPAVPLAVGASVSFLTPAQATAVANNSQAAGINNDLKSGVHVRGIDFGLSPSHKSTLCLKPKIKNVVADLDFWFGLDEFVCGLWARVNVPLTWTKWEVCTTETIQNVGGSNYGCGGVVQCPYNCTPNAAFTTVSATIPPLTTVVGFSASAAAPASGQVAAPAVVYTRQRDAWCGDKPFGQVPALKYAKLCCGKDDDFSVSGIRFDLGYDFWREECGHLGAGLTVVAGVGTKVCAERLFQPVVGAQHAWQFGGTLNGSYEAWSDDESSLTALFDATFVHVFREKQRRVFGLKQNGAWSHYLLLKKFRTDSAGAVVLDGFERAANILAADVKIKNDIMLDAAFALAYSNCNFTGTLGADVWFRSKEKISDCCGFGIEENRYGIKGQTGCDTKTASLSTINTSLGVGSNQTCGGTVLVNGVSAAASVAAFAPATEVVAGVSFGAPGCPCPGTLLFNQTLPVGVPQNVDDGFTTATTTPTACGLLGTVLPVACTPNTVYLKSSDVDPCPALHPDALSGKIFGSLEYAWDECDWEPFVLVGGEVEFGRGNTAVDQWGILFKGGVSF